MLNVLDKSGPNGHSASLRPPPVLKIAHLPVELPPLPPALIQLPDHLPPLPLAHRGLRSPTTRRRRGSPGTRWSRDQGLRGSASSRTAPVRRHPNPPGPRPPPSPRRSRCCTNRRRRGQYFECPRAGLLQTTHSGDGVEAPPGGDRAGKGPSRPSIRTRWPPGWNGRPAWWAP